MTSNILCMVIFDSSFIKNAMHTSYAYFSELIFWEIITEIIMTIMSLVGLVGL